MKAQTQIADFNQVFKTSFPDEEFDTVGGLVISRFGRLPNSASRRRSRPPVPGAARRQPAPLALLVERVKTPTLG